MVVVHVLVVLVALVGTGHCQSRMEHCRGHMDRRMEEGRAYPVSCYFCFGSDEVARNVMVVAVVQCSAVGLRSSDSPCLFLCPSSTVVVAKQDFVVPSQLFLCLLE